MPFSELLVNPLRRAENSIRSEITLRNKTIRTPFFGAKVVKSVDFVALRLEDELSFNPQALCFDITNAGKILGELRGEAAQRTLRLEQTNPYLDALLKTAFIVVDPRTEALCYNLEWRSAILGAQSFPARFAKVFETADTKSHNQAWFDTEKQHVALIEWCSSVQKRVGADLMIPPSPLLTGSDLPEMAKLVWAINMKFRSITREFSDGYPAFYIPFLPRVLDYEENLDTLVNLVEAAAGSQRVFVFKIVWYSGVSRPEQRKRLSEFLERIDGLKKSHKDGFIVVLLEAGSEGYPAMFNTVDGYFEPISGHVGFTKSPRDDSLPDVFGSWLNPKTREMMSFEELANFANKNSGYLPHDCRACEDWHGTLGNVGLNDRKWNLDRRVHHFQTRMAEIQDRLTPAIESNSIREEWLHLLEAGNKNHLDLAPARFWSTLPDVA